MNTSCPQCSRPIAPGQQHADIGAVRFCAASCRSAWLVEHGLRTEPGEPR